MNGDIIKKNDSFEITKKEGQDVIDNHDFFRDLSELMEDDKFKIFFEKYFTTMSETKITLVYMKLYQTFKNKWNEMNDQDLDKRINVFLLWKMMRDSNINRFALHTVLNHMENNKNNDIMKDLQQYIEFTDNNMKLKD